MKMKPVLKNILAVIAGVFIGGMVNMAIIMMSSYIIPPPEGADLKTMEGLKAAMHLMEPKHFLMPFLAHAIGTLVGSLIAAQIAIKNKMRFAIGISIWFFIGGLINIFLLPSPVWFTCVDLILAYLPFGYLAGVLITKRNASANK